MAWLLHTKQLDRFLPRLETTPSSVELASRRDAYGRDHPSLFPFKGQWTKQGVQVPPDLLPDSAILTSRHKALPDQFSLAGPAFSEKLTALVEAIEPDVHQFKQVPVFEKSGKSFAEAFFAVVLGHATTDQVVFDASTLGFSESGGVKRIHPPTAKDHGRICIDRSRSSGWHIWNALDLYSQMIVSDELHRQMVAASIDCFDYIELNEINVT